MSHIERLPIMGTGFWYGFDLDGTLAKYDKYISATHIGDPIEPMINIVKSCINKNYYIKIFTARVDGGQVARQMGLANADDFADVVAIKTAIGKWCLKHIGKLLPVTNVKDFGMLRLYDDRAVSVKMNVGHIAHFERDMLVQYTGSMKLAN